MTSAPDSRTPQLGLYLTNETSYGIEELGSVYQPFFTTVIVPETVIKQRVAEMGADIREAFGKVTITVVVILKGAWVFAADLQHHLNDPEIHFPFELDFVRVQSYVNEVQGSMKITGLDFSTFAGKHVLLIDDIFDSGTTMSTIYYKIIEHGPAEVKVAAFVFKRRETYTTDLRPDFVGVSIPDVWIAGYGMDYNEMLRNVPCIGIMSDFGKTKLAINK